MAKLILKGKIANVELSRSDTVDLVWATCVKHRGVKRPKITNWEYDEPGCTWIKEYGSLDEAAEHAADHADTGRQD